MLKEREAEILNVISQIKFAGRGGFIGGLGMLGLTITDELRLHGVAPRTQEVKTLLIDAAVMAVSVWGLGVIYPEMLRRINNISFDEAYGYLFKGHRGTNIPTPRRLQM